MKKLIFLATVTAAIFAGCSSDNPMLPVDDGNGNNGGGEPSGMVSPRVRATVDTPENPQSPMTGILEIYPCRPGTSIYFGNYIEGKLTPFPGMYTLKDGNTFGEPNRPLSLPVGTYNMVYWGTPKYEEPIYSNPVVMDPQLTIGGDLAQQYFSMRQNIPDTTYYPVYDLVYAVKPASIGSEELSAAMKRQVAGMKVIVKDRNNGVLSSSIDSMVVHVGELPKS